MNEQTKEPIKLKVGDKLYAQQYSSVNGCFVIDRITSTQAISKTTRFKIALSSWGTAEKIGRSSWDSTTYYLENDKIKEQYERRLTLYNIKNFVFSVMSTEDLLIISELINKHKK